MNIKKMNVRIGKLNVMFDSATTGDDLVQFVFQVEGEGTVPARVSRTELRELRDFFALIHDGVS